MIRKHPTLVVATLVAFCLIWPRGGFAQTSVVEALARAISSYSEGDTQEALRWIDYARALIEADQASGDGGAPEGSRDTDAEEPGLPEEPAVDSERSGSEPSTDAEDPTKEILPVSNAADLLAHLQAYEHHAYGSRSELDQEFEAIREHLLVIQELEDRNPRWMKWEGQKVDYTRGDLVKKIGEVEVAHEALANKIRRIGPYRIQYHSISHRPHKIGSIEYRHHRSSGEIRQVAGVDVPPPAETEPETGDSEHR